MRRTPGLVVVFAAALAAASTLAPGATAAPAQVGGYVVVLEDGAGPPAAVAERLADRYGGEVGFVYSHALRGFSIRTTDRAAAALANNPKVDYVEADGVMSIAEQDTPTGVERVFAPGNAKIGIDGADDKRVDVDVAVIDTGIDLDHPDLNVVGSTNCTNESGGPWWNRTVTCSDSGDDDHYHGTHVAGTVAALDNGIGVVGVAPGARLWAVKVLKSNGSGSNSMVIAGIDWVAERASTIEVANLSLGGSKAQAVNDAVAGAVADGVSVVVAAGNSAADAKDYSPASEPTAITVSALADFDGAPGGEAPSTCRSDVDDTFANFSNYGTVVDIIAPGVCILSTYPNGAYNTISGTSMASPHVAGAVALLRSMGKGVVTAESDVKKGNTNWNDVDDPDNVQEPLLDVSSTTLFDPTLVSGGGSGEANTAPTASFTHACTERACSFTDTSSDSDGTIASRTWAFGDGSNSTDTNPSHTYDTDGTYTVTLTVNDDDGAIASTSQSVTVASGFTGLSFTGTSSNGPKGTWVATITVTSGTPGTTYSGNWDSGTGGSCTADASGSCSFDQGGIAKKVASVTWTPTVGQPVTVFKP